MIIIEPAENLRLFWLHNGLLYLQLECTALDGLQDLISFKYGDAPRLFGTQGNLLNGQQVGYSLLLQTVCSALVDVINSVVVGLDHSLRFLY
mmetsp:Transcript_40943/g.39498  ORF Transcript_40943/g.39498 Transcript_40943/m.39498 type:complete len:92 (-) Transcript_40943:269-544(-)